MNHDKEKVYVRATNLMKKAQEEHEADESETISKLSKATISSRVNETRKTAGKEGETYTIAIAAGHNNTNDTGARKGILKEEELTIKTAEKVEELLKPYTNIKVVQTGSTANNRGGIQVRDRVRLAREANPDLCIQIHYDAGGGSGVQGIYKEGDAVSRQLAEFLSTEMAEAMGLPDKGAGSDQERTAVKNLGIIENSVTSGFPSVVTEGGFVDGEPDATLLKSNGTELCAQGIVEGILKYLEADHSGLVAINKGDETVQESIESRVYNLKYIEQDEMDNYINKGDLKALKFFTLDDNKKLITATWERSAEGEIRIKKNSAMDFRTALQKYTMPYEYLLYFYINTNIYEFAKELAEEVLKTEIVIAVEDNVRTTKTIEVTREKQEATINKYSYEGREINTQTIITENCTPKIEVTYADAWCVKYYKENSYSRKALNWQEETTEQIVNIKGKVTTTENHTSTSYEPYESGKATTGDLDEEGKPISYNYTKYRKIETDTKTMEINYDTGKGKTVGNENKFVKLYQKNNMQNWVRVYHLFRIIEENERTINLLTLTKYLIYKATSDRYGEIEYAFSEFDLDAFSSSSSGVYGNTTQERMWWAILGAGYSKEAAAGVLGNIEAESGFRVDAIEGGYTADNGGIGLCQWTNYPRSSGKGRNANLKAYASSKGKEWTDEMAQIEYLIYEITPGGSPDGLVKYALVNYHGYTPDNWKNATTPEDAAIAFCWTFERPGVPRMDPRTQAARKYYEQFKDLEKPSGSGNILQTCEEVMKDMMARNVRYSQSGLIWENIEAEANHPYACCATYVSIVLYKSGLLTADQINAYNYNYTGSGGLPDMLAAAGWRQVSHDEIQPGDVINHYEEHALIYAGGDMVYDQNCGVISSGGKPPIGAPFNAWSRYKGRANVQVWRAP